MEKELEESLDYLYLNICDCFQSLGHLLEQQQKQIPARLHFLYQLRDSWSRARTQYSSLSRSVNTGKQSELSAWNGRIVSAKHLHEAATGTISFQFYNKVLVSPKQQKETASVALSLHSEPLMLRPPILWEEIIQSSIIELSHQLNPAFMLMLQGPNLEPDLIYLRFRSSPTSTDERLRPYY